MKKKNPLNFNIKLTERELEIIQFIQSQEGQNTPVGVIHHIIAAYYTRQYFDKRAIDPQRKISEDTMTPEEKCKSIGGEIDTRNQTCKRKIGALTEVTPLHLL